MTVRQRMYGNREKQYQLSLSDFFCYLKDDFDAYVGIEKCTPEELNFTVMYRSKYYNCYHLLYVQTAPENIFDRKERLQATLHTYIPNQNIKNLYGEYIENDKRHITIDLKNKEKHEEN
jgi:predicted nucleic acid-binding Zn finger protein